MRPVLLRAVYTTVLVGSAGVAIAIAYWLASQRDHRGRRAFLGLLGLCVLWSGIPGIALLLSDPQMKIVLTYVRAAVGIAGVFAWFAFARIYTSRDVSVSSPVAVGALASGVALVVGIVTNPVHSLYWESVTVQSAPFEYVATAMGPLKLARNLWAYALIGLALFYLLELFFKSRHRSSRSIGVLVIAAVLASLPNVLSMAELTPLVGYEHTPLGIVPFVGLVAYAVFNLGMFDLRPMARDELVDRLDDGFLVVDDEERVVDHNVGARRLLGLSGDPTGVSLADVSPELDTAVAFSEVSGRTTSQFTRTDGEERRHYSVQVTAVRDDNEVVGHSLLVRDVTDIEEYKRELERQNEQLEQFASTVTHDLRNPLQVAQGHAQFLDEAVSDTDTESADVPDRIERIDAALGRMEQIIADLRTMARKGQSVEETEHVYVSDVVSQAWDHVETADATIEIVSSGTVQADRSRLLTIFENLFRNAIEHGSPDVTLEVGLCESGFYVTDDGPGIPEEYRESIFEYGVTTDEGSTGLGLAIVRMMAESHGWTVRVDPEYSDGARFVFENAVIERDERDLRSASYQSAES